MFTGIVQKTGKIEEILKEKDKICVRILAKEISDLSEGDSINVNGICSTITEFKNDEFCVEYMPETINKTTIRDWKNQYKVNLESPLKLNDKLSGHLVLGHIDSTGEIIKINSEEETREIDISYPHNLKKYIALKGSIAVDGVSLTVSYLEKDYFRVSLIPYTLKNTTFGEYKEGDIVNIEIDMISRYLKQLFDERDKQTNYEYLKERGFI